MLFFVPPPSKKRVQFPKKSKKPPKPKRDEKPTPDAGVREEGSGDENPNPDSEAQNRRCKRKKPTLAEVDETEPST